MTNQITIYNDFTQLEKAADALHKSGYFGDVKSMAQALVKVMAGAELGIPPFASMTGINIIQGKPTLGANVLATLVKNDQRYDYQVIKCDETECTLDWYENGKRRGQSGFTIREAQNAGLTSKDNWKKYPSDMLFARAISRGARRFAPGIFGGSPVYTPDELGVDTDPDGYIDTTARDVPAEKEAETTVTIPPEVEAAMNIKSSKGLAYGEIATKNLSAMANTMTETLAKPDTTDEHRAEIEPKLKAAKIILDWRQAHP